MKSAVLLLVYKRPDTVKQIFDVLKKVKPPRLYISANGPNPENIDEERLCAEVRAIFNNIDWSCQVYRNFRNEFIPKASNSVYSGITWFFENETEGIIFEDDILPNEDFFYYCDELLEKYRDDERISSIGGTNAFYDPVTNEYSYFFSHFKSIWGWASWRRVWSKYKLSLNYFPQKDFLHMLNAYNFPSTVKRFYKIIYISLDLGLIDTWDYQFLFSQWYNNQLSIIPIKNVTMNIGVGRKDAVHTKENNSLQLNHFPNKILPIKHPSFFEENKELDLQYIKQGKIGLSLVRYLKSFIFLFFYKYLFKKKHTNLQKIISKILPDRIKRNIKKILYFFSLRKSYNYDRIRYLKYSATLDINSETKLLGRILATTHVLEKGLTMPKVKLGFGINRVSELVNYCQIYKKHKFGNCTAYLHAISVIKEYFLFHKSQNYIIATNIAKKIQDFIEQNVDNISIEHQIELNGNSYFNYINSSFPAFSNSRHSMRNLSASIDTSSIVDALKLAANTPTACNRQPQCAHIIENKNLITEILQLQDGNRGFGYLTDKLLIITVDLSGYCGFNERNYPFVDGGIYAMNVLYALHYYKIGACTLNWCYTPAMDKKLRKLIKLRDSETVILFIMCGKVPNKLIQLTVSKRNSPTIFYDK